ENTTPGSGYHDSFTYNGTAIRFVVAQYATTGAMVLFDHEITEAVTDPFGMTWRDLQFVGEGEVADLCNGLRTRIGSEIAEKVWSQNQCKCLSRSYIALTGGSTPGVGPWGSIPIAFSNGDGSFSVTNSGVDTFPALAAPLGVRPVM